jgi:hypothetical protein
MNKEMTNIIKQIGVENIIKQMKKKQFAKKYLIKIQIL